MRFLRSTVLRTTGKLGPVPIVLVLLLGIYLAYVVKAKLGVDFLAEGGLHLVGPRTLLRQLAAWLCSS